MSQADVNQALSRLSGIRGEIESAHADVQEVAKAAGLGSPGDRQDLRTAQNVAAAARSIIAQGESRLRQLGASPSGGGHSSGTKPKR